MKKEIITSTYSNLPNNKSFNNLGSILDMSKKFGRGLTVYEKIDNLDPELRIISEKSNPDYNTIQTRNSGSCDYSFIRHIHDNYDNLSELMVFVKVNIYDVIAPADVHSKFFTECENYDFMDFGDYPIRAVWNLDLEYKNSDHLEVGYGGRENRDHEYSASSDWFDFIFKGYPKPKTTFSIWDHGPLFCVSRDLVRRHNKDVYKYLLDTFDDEFHFSKNGYDSSRNYGRFCPRHDLWQRFWRVLFTNGHERDGEFRIHQNGHYYLEEHRENKKDGYVIPKRTN
jgi:hypothetical protein